MDNSTTRGAQQGESAKCVPSPSPDHPPSTAAHLSPVSSYDDLRESSPASGRSATNTFMRMVASRDLEGVTAAVMMPPLFLSFFADALWHKLKENPSLACERDYYGNTGLHLAVAKKALPLVQLLLQSAGTEMDAQEGVHKRTACHIASSLGAADILAALVARGASFELRNARGETPLHGAAKHGRFDCLELLLSSGARVDEQDEVGCTPLMRACEAGALECAKLLLVARAKMDVQDSIGRCALHHCSQRGRLLCLRALLQNGADPFRVDGQQRTVADVARAAGHDDCATEVESFCAALARGGGKRGKRPISQWTVRECVEWAREESLGNAVAEAFSRHDVSGSVLLGVTDAVLRDELGVAAWGARKKASAAIEALQARWQAEQDVAQRVPAGVGQEGAKAVVFEELVMGELLGMGNFGEVKRASWRGTDVAVKVIYRKTLFHDKDHRQLFQQEVGIISQLHHPNIVQFIGTCQSVPDGHFCLVTEFCGGGSLRQLIAENSTALLRGNLRNRIARDVCRAMVHLHKWKPPILHRDLTSSNLLLDHALTCKLADFGLSRESFRDRTLTGGFGAVAWMDPVVLRGGTYLTASDVYSFGMCCFEMVAMQVPHHGMTPLRFAEMTSRGHRPRIPPSAPPEWNTLITQCWSSDPSRRPTFVELLERVEAMPVAPDKRLSAHEDERKTDEDGSALPVSTEFSLGVAGEDGYING